MPCPPMPLLPPPSSPRIACSPSSSVEHEKV